MFIDKLLSLGVGLLFLLVLSCDGPSERSEGNAAALTSQSDLASDSAFWDYAASSNLLQTRIGQLTMEKSESEQLRMLAEKAVRYHSEALKKLKRLAKQHTSLQLPDSLASADTDLVKKFEQLQGEELDTRYRAFISSTHQSQLLRYEEALQKTENPKIRNWLRDMLTHLQEELQQHSQLDTLQEEPVR